MPIGKAKNEKEKSRRISLALKGKKFSDEHKRKLSIVASKRIGIKNHFYGKKHTNKTKDLIRKKQTGKRYSKEVNKKKGMKGKDNPNYGNGKKISGSKNPNWRGGISCLPYSIDWTETLRRSIRERDMYVCKLCGKQQGDRLLSVHHIDYNKKNCNPNNLISLCRDCHLKTNFKRKGWINYFKNLINI